MVLIVNSRMKLVPQSLQRMFWSLYGRLAWDAARPPWKATQVRQIVEILKAQQVVPDEWVLDAGCGTGDLTLALAEAGFQVIGADYAEGMLVRARAKVTGELADSISFQQVDLNRRLHFPDARFDHVINISVLQVAAEPTFTLGELWRVLRPGGTLVLLHVPRSDSYNLPLREAIGYRIQDLEKKTPWRVALVATKVWAERTGSTRFWTAEALQEMIRNSQFRVLSVNQGPPIVIVATRPDAEQNAAQQLAEAGRGDRAWASLHSASVSARRKAVKPGSPTCCRRAAHEYLARRTLPHWLAQGLG